MSLFYNDLVSRRSNLAVGTSQRKICYVAVPYETPADQIGQVSHGGVT